MEPPRLARALIEGIVPPPLSAALLGDLDEEFARIFQERGAWRARVWYWSQALSPELWRLRHEARRLSAAGRSPGEAGADARRREWLWVGGWVRDVRHGFRRWAGSPLFTLVAVVSLAVGIAADTAVFSLVHSVLGTSLPSDEPDRIVQIYTSRKSGAPTGATSYPDFLAMRDLHGVFEHVAAHTVMPAWIGDGSQGSTVFGEAASWDLLATLGLRPALGRSFAADDVVRGDRVVMVGFRYWVRHMGADSSVLGRTLLVDGSPYTLVGVLPEKLTSLTMPGLGTDFLLPLEPDPTVTQGPNQTAGLEDRGSRSLSVVARIRPAVSMARVAAALEVSARRLQGAFPDTNAGRLFYARPASEIAIHPDVDRLLLPVAALLLLAGGIIVLITCTNLASFLLARAVDRQPEIALRRALGAARSVLARQMLVETSLLGLAAGALGVAAAQGILNGLRSLQPPMGIPFDPDVGLNTTVLLFSVAVSTGAGLLLGLAPALRSTDPALTAALKGEGGAGRPRGGVGLRDALITGQIALSLLLLVSAGFFVRSFQAARATDLGFTMRHGALVTVDLATGRLDPREWRPVLSRIRERVRSATGSQNVGMAQVLPLGVYSQEVSVDVPGVEPPPGLDHLQVGLNRVTRGYLGALGLSLTRGRWFSEEDREHSEPVVVISEAAARRFWPAEDPLGKTIGDPDGPPHRVIGVLRDTKVTGLGPAPEPYMYWLWDQSPTPRVTVVVPGPAAASYGLVMQVRDAVQGADGRVLVTEAKTMEQHLAISLYPRRLAALLLGALGAVALALAAMGLFGLVGHSVARRSREVGIRIALGATTPDVLGTVLGKSLRLVAMGTLVGLLGALALGRVLSGYLLGAGTADVFSLIGMPVLLAGVTVVAALIPARRACRIDPAEAMRTQ